MQEYYTVREVAGILKVEDQTIRKYITDGKIKALKLSSRLLRIPIKELDKLLNPKKGFTIKY